MAMRSLWVRYGKHMVQVDIGSIIGNEAEDIELYATRTNKKGNEIARRLPPKMEKWMLDSSFMDDIYEALYQLRYDGPES